MFARNQLAHDDCTAAEEYLGMEAAIEMDARARRRLSLLGRFLADNVQFHDLTIGIFYQQYLAI